MEEKLIHIAGVAGTDGVAVTGIYFDRSALLGYAANVVEHVFKDSELAAKLHKLAQTEPPAAEGNEPAPRRRAVRS